MYGYSSRIISIALSVILLASVFTGSLILQQFEGDSGNKIAYAMQYWETNEAEEIDSSTQT
jgi:hypothetical protein